MEKPKLLIADSADDLRNCLAQLFHSAYTVRTARDGTEALELLLSFRPDIFVLDFMLPGIDGITLLQRASQHQQTPKTLAMTRYLSDYTLESAQRLGVGYIILKPCDASAIVARVSDLRQTIQPSPAPHADPRTAVTNLLLRLGVPAKLRGYGYLREAILQMSLRSDQSITKELYPAVASIFRATAVQIERSIRSAITTAWEHRDNQIWQLYFPSEQTHCLSRPTNATFICRLADSLTLESEIDTEE